MRFINKCRMALLAWMAILDIMAIVTIAFGSISAALVMTAVTIVNGHIWSKAVTMPVRYFYGIDNLKKSDQVEILLSMSLNANYNNFCEWNKVSDVNAVKKFLYANMSVVSDGDIVRVRGFEHMWAKDKATLLVRFGEYLGVDTDDEV